MTRQLTYVRLYAIFILCQISNGRVNSHRRGTVRDVWNWQTFIVVV